MQKELGKVSGGLKIPGMTPVTPDPLNRLVAAARQAAGHRREDGAAARLPHPARAARAARPSWPGARGGEEQGAALRALLRLTEGRALRLLHRPAPRRPGAVRGRGHRRPDGRGADARVQGPLPRAARRALPARGHRARSSCASGSCSCGWRTARWRRSSSPPTRTSRARRRRSISMRLLKPMGIEVTRLAQGLPMGGDLEFADQATLARALAGRREL